MKYDKPLSSLAFSFNLGRFIQVELADIQVELAELRNLGRAVQVDPGGPHRTAGGAPLCLGS